MIEELKKNIESEIEMLREISNFSKRLEFASPYERKIITNSIESLKRSIKIINNSVPKMLRDISASKKLPAGFSIGAKAKKTNLESIRYGGPESEIRATVDKKDRERLLKELSINENLIKKLKKKKIRKKEDVAEFKAARGYLKFANRFFLERAKEWAKKGNFKQLSIEIKKANIDVLFEAYIAMIFLTVLISIFASVFLVILLMFLDVHLTWPVITIFKGNYLLRLAKIFWLVLAIPVGTFLALYFYPSAEKRNTSKKIDRELPFAVIHMSAISGSGIEPGEIFRIIGLSRDYPNLRKEIRKVLNQINLYGYDLVTALNNVAKTTPSEGLAKLFSGLSTTIHSGGGLKIFFEKRAESLLVSYRLERERYTRIAETFMDIYISVIIAAPMILLLLVIMVSISGIGFGFSAAQMGFLIIAAIALINIVFLGFLHIKQPKY